MRPASCRIERYSGAGVASMELEEEPAGENRISQVSHAHGARGQLYFRRQSLWELGPEAEAWLTELVHRRPARWRTDVEACFALLQDYGAPRLRAAFGWGVRHGAIGAEYVRTHLATRSSLAEVTA